MSTTNSLALIIISAGVFFLFGRPALSDMNILREEQKNFEKAIEEISLLEQKKDELAAKLAAISEEDRGRIDSFLPSEEGIIRFVADIDALASKYGISISTVNIGESSANTASSIAEAQTPSDYNSKTISMNFSANYGALIRFLSDLEKSLRIIDIKSVKLSGNEESSGVYQYELRGSVYWLNNAEPQ
jgi:Tfp pilus assembly protein PilO